MILAYFLHISRSAIIKSLEQLFLLGALTDECKLSNVGQQMARLPLDPAYAKALILASEFKCLEEMLIAVAMLSVESIFFAPREKLEEVCVCVWSHVMFFSLFWRYLRQLYRLFTGKDRDEILFKSRRRSPHSNQRVPSM